MYNGFGTEEGELCNRNGCVGVIAEHPLEGCSCHISPPCSACTTDHNYCPVCDWSGEEEQRTFYFNGFRCVAVSPEDAKLQMYGETPLQSWKPRPLDPTKIDYHTRSHTHFSQIHEGVYPEGTSHLDVLKLVEGTFGGRFEYFAYGRFKYIAYTD